MTTTVNYSWALPTVGASVNTWGTLVNNILTDIDAKMVSKTDAQTLTNKTLAAPVITGGASISGNVSVTGDSSATGTIYSSARGTSAGFLLPDWRMYNTSSGNGLAWNNGSDRMTLDASGNLLVGVSSNSYSAVCGTKPNNFAFGVYNYSSTSPYGMYIATGATGGGGDDFLYCTDASAARFRVLGSGNCQNQNNSYGAISDPDLKTNISLAKSQWDDVKRLARNVVKYNFKSDPDGFKQIGFLSRDHEGITGVRSISPGLVQPNPDIEEYEVEPARTETKTTKKQKVTYSESVRYEVVEIEGKYTQLPIRTTVETPVFEVFPLFDEDGDPVLETAAPATEAQAEVLDDEGNVVSPAVAANPAVYRQAVHQVPVMEDVTETVEIPAVMGRRETGKSTDSVQYSIANMKAFKALGEALERIESLEAKFAALEARA